MKQITIFMTGGSGTIGMALVPLFLENEKIKVRLLVRAESDLHLEEKLIEMCRYWGKDYIHLLHTGRLKGFRGDVKKDHLGLEKRDFEEVRKETTNIVHAAGQVKLNQSLADARKSAVDSLINIIELAKHCQAKLDYVSTIGVAGRKPGRVPEEPITAPRKFHNTYEQAKAEAEEFLLEEMKMGLPGTIYRPSMVVGDSISGRISNFQVFYHLSDYFCGFRSSGYLPQFGPFKLDLIPVDYVARAIKLATLDPSTKGMIFHLISGGDNAKDLEELSDKIRAIYAGKGVDLPKLRVLPQGIFKIIILLLRIFGSAKFKKSLGNLKYFLTYIQTQQSYGYQKTFSYFKGRGLVIPPIDKWLKPVLSYYIDDKRKSH